MKVLFTGISSFTGYWFANTLVAAGHEVIAPLSGGLERYEGVRRRRMEQLKSNCRLMPEAPFGSDAFLKVIKDQGPWDLLCHHAAEVTNFKSPDFDVHRALLANTLNLPSVLANLTASSLKAVVLTGSYFENDEGLGNEPVRAFSPYGLSKALTWQVFRYYCSRAGVRLSKFVIPNPFGPFEDERFTAYLMRTWSSQKPASVKTPLYVRDNIPVDLLTRVYLRCVEHAVTGSETLQRSNPSGYVESQGAFASRVAGEVRRRTGWPCELELGRQTDFTEPLMRLNSQPASPLFPDWDEAKFWDSFVGFYRP